MRTGVSHRLLLALLAAGVSSCHAGLGPTVGYRFNDGARVGWEASGGFAVARASVGQTFGYSDAPNTDFYVAGEPGIILGATLGADYASGKGWGFMPGGWIAAPPFYPWGETDRRSDVLGMQPAGSVAIGYRYVHGHEIYITPKFYLIERITFH